MPGASAKVLGSKGQAPGEVLSAAGTLHVMDMNSDHPHINLIGAEAGRRDVAPPACGHYLPRCATQKLC